MSNEVKRIYGWAVNKPIPMRGGGVAYVVCERIGALKFVLSGYSIEPGDIVRSMSWMADGKTDVVANHCCDLDPSYRVIPEPELPMWTIADSKVLLGLTLKHQDRIKAAWVSEVFCDGRIFINGCATTYAKVTQQYTYLDGTPIPQRRMP